MSILLETRGLGVLYKRSIQGIADVSISVEEGQTVAILGANGAGKSTTLRAITGFIGLDDARISAGEVIFDGHAVTHFPPHRMAALGVVLVPEREKVFPNLTVQENLAVVAHKDHAGDDLIYAFFPRLAELRGKLAGLLSGGERQMLAMGRALMAHPRLLMLDEPSLGLAPLIVRDILQTVSRLRDTGVSILLVEQNARAALAVADTAYVMELGTITLSGPAREIAADPKVSEIYLGGAG